MRARSPRATRVVTWTGGPHPKIGEFVRLAGGGVYWRVRSVAVLSVSDDRLAIGIARTTGNLPRDAVRHPASRVSEIEPCRPPVVRQIAGDSATTVLNRDGPAGRRITVDGRRRLLDPIRRAIASGALGLTDRHVVAADTFRALVDLAWSGSIEPVEINRVGSLSMAQPRSQPSRKARKALDASRIVKRIAAGVPDHQAAIVARVVFERKPISECCAMPDLVAALDALAAAIENDRAAGPLLE